MSASSHQRTSEAFRSGTNGLRIHNQFATYRAGSRRELWLRALCATVGGSRGEPLCYRRWQPRGAIVLPSVAAAGSHCATVGGSRGEPAGESRFK